LGKTRWGFIIFFLAAAAVTALVDYYTAAVFLIIPPVIAFYHWNKKAKEAEKSGDKLSEAFANFLEELMFFTATLVWFLAYSIGPNPPSWVRAVFWVVLFCSLMSAVLATAHFVEYRKLRRAPNRPS
jgi:hypothetical protein